MARIWKNNYVLALVLLIAVAAASHLLLPVVGYRAVGFIFLIAVVALGLFSSPRPIFLNALLSTLIWNFFFIPPTFTFFIQAPEDIMMCITYFAVAALIALISSRLRHIENVRRELGRLEEAEKINQIILHSISHELKTPLTTIIGSATALENTNAISREVPLQQLVSGILRSGERLNRLIENLLDTSRFESGLISLNLDWHDLEDIVNAAIASLKEMLVKHPVKVEIASDFPLMRVDYSLFKHALENIVLNASIYSPPDRVITIRADNKGKDLHISVEDEGPGIPLPQRKDIFKKFHRIPGSPPGGTGLGLFIASSIISAHGGTIEVSEGRKGAGSLFTISLPSEIQPVLPRSEVGRYQ